MGPSLPGRPGGSGSTPSSSFEDVRKDVEPLPAAGRQDIENDVEACCNPRVPCDAFIDTSMPTMVRGMDGLGGGEQHGESCCVVTGADRPFLAHPCQRAADGASDRRPQGVGDA